MPDNLDAFVQILVTALGLAIGTAIAAHGYTKKWVDKLPKPPVNKALEKATDTVVISGAFADTAVISKLQKTIELLSEKTEESNKHNEEILSVLKAIAANSDTHCTIQRTHTNALDGMTNVVRSLVEAIYSRVK